MSPGDPLFPSLKDVEETSAEFDKLANAVSEKLAAFLGWLNDLPGRTEVEAFSANPDASDHSDLMGLRIGRGKAGWQLYYAFAADGGFDGPQQHGSWEPLEGASLEVRCAALSLLPVLIQKMHSEQKRLVERLRSAKSVLDTLPITAKRAGKGGA
jgi:hypothetical protein